MPPRDKQVAVLRVGLQGLVHLRRSNVVRLVLCDADEVAWTPSYSVAAAPLSTVTCLKCQVLYARRGYVIRSHAGVLHVDGNGEAYWR